ncbi:MAG: Nramp family divalent metal transporter [Candidatus Dormibacteria bacterium]
MPGPADPVAAPDERPDPLRQAVSTIVDIDPEPTVAEVAKPGSGPATGAPPPGTSVLEASRQQGALAILQVLGPGLVTGASDDDPSGIGTYSQAGSQFGLATLWLALFTLPLMIAVQEACARIALHTGAGLGTVLRRRFPTRLVGLCIVAVLIANTINVGADIGAVAAAGSLLSAGRIPALWLVVPVGVAILVMQLRLPYALIFRLFKALTLALFAYVLTAFIVHPPLLTTLRATVVPSLVPGKDFLAIVVAIFGTTISPYLFFWQASSEVEEMKAAGAGTERERRGVTARELRARRVDVVVGMLFSQLVMYCIILTAGTVLHNAGQTGISTAQQAAQALQPLAGRFAFLLFSLGMIGTGLLAIPVLSGSAAYAVKEFFGFRGSLADRPRYRPTFYAIVVVSTLGGLAMNLVGIDAIQALVVTAIINGVVAPPILFLIAMTATDGTVMGRRRSGRLSAVLLWTAAIVMAVAALGMIATLL